MGNRAREGAYCTEEEKPPGARIEAPGSAPGVPKSGCCEEATEGRSTGASPESAAEAAAGVACGAATVLVVAP